MKQIRHPTSATTAEMQAKQEPSDPASSPEVMKTLVVEALIWNKGRWEGILLPRGVEVVLGEEEVWKKEDYFV